MPDPSKVRVLLDSIIEQAQAARAELDIDDPVPVPVPPSTNIVRVKTGDDLAGAILSLKATGGTVLAAPGRHTMNLHWQDRQTDNGKLVIVRPDTANIPDEGVLMREGNGDDLAWIASDNVGPTVFGDLRSGGLAFVGIGFAKTPHPDRTLVRFGGDKKYLTAPEDRPSGFTFDRCLAIGDTNSGQHRWIDLNAANINIRGCTARNMFEFGRDSQVLCGWNGTKNILIENVDFEGGAEVLMFGGSDPATADMNPQDVIVRGFRLARNDAWRQLPRYKEINMKCLFEIKNMQRYRMSGGLLEKNWGKNWGNGPAFTIKCANQENTAPFTTCEDVTIEYLMVRDVGSFMTVVAKNDGQHESQQMKRIKLRHIVAHRMNVNGYTGDARMWPSANLPDGITLDHLTVIGNRNALHNFWFDQGAVRGARMLLQNSCFEEGTYGVHPSGVGINNVKLGQDALTAGYGPMGPDGWQMKSNVIANTPDRAFVWPESNTLVSENDYRNSFTLDGAVRPGSAVATAVTTTDGEPVGANVQRIAESIPFAL